MSPAEAVRILAVDTETCALGHGRDRIVQFCAVTMDGHLNVLDVWTQLVNPGVHIPAAATAIHGIRDADVRDQPRFGDVGPRLRALLLPDTVFMAYNAPFDLGVLNLEFARAGIERIPPEQPVLDPLQIERRVTSRSLSATYARYTGQPLADAHRADADTFAMIDVLRHQQRVHGLPDDLRTLTRPEWNRRAWSWRRSQAPGQPGHHPGGRASPTRQVVFAAPERDGGHRLHRGKPFMKTTDLAGL